MVKADRWRLAKSGTGTTSVSQGNFTVGQTDADNPKNFISLNKSSETSGYNDYITTYRRCRYICSTQCTLSFWESFRYT